MKIVSQRLAGEGDYALVRSLLIEVTGDRSHAHYCTIGDLDWWRATEDDPEDIWQMQMWLDDGRAVAISWPDYKKLADVIVHPAYSDLLPDIFAWTEEQFLEASNGSSLEIYSYSKDETRNAALQARGYEPGEFAYRNFAIDLAGSVASPSLPADYVFRDMRGPTDEEIQRRVDVHVAAFGPSEMTLAKHQRVMASPTYRPELDLVIAAADGAFAAFAILWFDEANKTGLFEPVGTHPDHQRRGLGRALMAEGLRQLVALGATRALVSTGPENVEANGLYHASGFQVVDDNVTWTKSLRRTQESIG